MFPLTTLAQETTPVGTTLENETQRADSKKNTVRKLKQRAGRISTRLSDIETDIKTLQRQVTKQEKILATIQSNEKNTREAHFELEKQKQKISLELSGLIQSLWPLHLQNVRTRFNNIKSWGEFDRRFTWMTDIYDATKAKLDEARLNSQKIAHNLEQQQFLADEAEKQLATINNCKDRLLNSKYSLRKKLRQVRHQRKTAEKELNDILSTIDTLKYQLSSQKTKHFTLYKQTLPWPVRGDIIKEFNLKKKPPIRGMFIRTKETASVQSIFWGKVVHNDTLRGFGHVIIVYHGYNYYSLYAYLSKTFVRNGQEVEKNEPLGLVGFTPKANGPGMYFELRFHQKPINPKLWLTALK